MANLKIIEGLRPGSRTLLEDCTIAFIFMHLASFHWVRQSIQNERVITRSSTEKFSPFLAVHCSACWRECVEWSAHVTSLWLVGWMTPWPAYNTDCFSVPQCKCKYFYLINLSNRFTLWGFYLFTLHTISLMSASHPKRGLHCWETAVETRLLGSICCYYRLCLISKRLIVASRSMTFLTLEYCLEWHWNVQYWALYYSDTIFWWTLNLTCHVYISLNYCLYPMLSFCHLLHVCIVYQHLHFVALCFCVFLYSTQFALCYIYI